MSIFGKLFGAKKEEPTLSAQDSLQKLQQTEDLLIKKTGSLRRQNKSRNSNRKDSWY